MAKRPRQRIRSTQRGFENSYEDSRQKYSPQEQQHTVPKKTLHLKDLKRISPITEAQEDLFFSWYDADKNGHMNAVVGAVGSAGTGKTMLACYLGLQAVLDEDTPYDKFVIIRSVVPSRNIGFLPGEEEDKVSPYKAPYRQVFDKLFPWTKSFDNMCSIGLVDFEITSFMRGQTFENCITLFDESQNTTEVEFDTILTRIGKNCRLIFAGDTKQNDLGSSALSKALPILRATEGTAITEFRVEDIVRSGWVTSYLTAKYKIGN